LHTSWSSLGVTGEDHSVCRISKYESLQVCCRSARSDGVPPGLRPWSLSTFSNALCTIVEFHLLFARRSSLPHGTLGSHVIFFNSFCPFCLHPLGLLYTSSLGLCRYRHQDRTLGRPLHAIKLIFKHRLLGRLSRWPPYRNKNHSGSTQSGSRVPGAVSRTLAFA
jgi:hypothetical protein